MLSIFQEFNPYVVLRLLILASKRVKTQDRLAVVTQIQSMREIYSCKVDIMQRLRAC